MTSFETRRSSISYWLRVAGNGAAAGCIAAYPLGALFGITQFLPYLGHLVGRDTPLAAFIVHFTFSAFYGAVFAILTVRLHLAIQFFFKWWKTFPMGAIYGAILWFINNLIAIPVVINLRILVADIVRTQAILLVGHLIYGLIMALSFSILFWRKPRIRLISRGGGYATRHFLGHDAASIQNAQTKKKP
jgi:hypothetical protein